jgi:preprotein translocase SecE subunit
MHLRAGENPNKYTREAVLEYMVMNLKTVWTEIAQYPRGVLEEIRKIDWPTRQKTIELTVAVIVVIAIAAVYVGAVDLLFSRAVAFILAQ